MQMLLDCCSYHCRNVVAPREGDLLWILADRYEAEATDLYHDRVAKSAIHQALDVKSDLPFIFCRPLGSSMAEPVDETLEMFFALGRRGFSLPSMARSESDLSRRK
jgi:hypothetical protein